MNYLQNTTCDIAYKRSYSTTICHVGNLEVKKLLLPQSRTPDVDKLFKFGLMYIHVLASLLRFMD